MSDIEIPINETEEKFQATLEILGNTRIFFSGPFGVGKTYFLNKFFQNRSDIYEVYHLFPINYQIHGNDDVINLIKYDLLVELSKKDENIFKTKEVGGISESSLLFYSWIKENYSTNQFLTSTISIGEFLSDLSADPIIGLLSKLGRPLKSLLKIDESFQEFKKEYKSNEKGLVDMYEKQIRIKNTSEPDYISSLIKEKIIENKKSKKSVLVLDDMDRIDPEQIFRIFNILSAHFEQDQKNKFDFDYIIIVADYSNMEHIFHHRFGAKTDFSGYMDKFFSIAPFCFDNKKALVSTIDEIVKKIKNEDEGLVPAVGDGGYIKIFLEHIFVQSAEKGIINLRQLLKATNFQLLELKKGSFRKDHFSDNFQMIFDISIKIAIHSFSNPSAFINRIEIIKATTKATKKRLPFKVFIKTMLKSRNIDLDKNESLIIEVIANGNEYKITRDQLGLNDFQVMGDREESLFYDLLIQYVKDEKYNKDSFHDYLIN